MDEPQEGMDSENMIERLKTLSKEERRERYSINDNVRDKTYFKTLDPLFKIRYSATHKVMKNLIYRLTPYDSYKQGLVKKIEVLTVTEKNDEATIKIELTQTQFSSNHPKVKVKAWNLKAGKFVFEETIFLKKGDNLGDKTGNPSYRNYTITRINKSLHTGKWTVEFSNGATIEEKQASGNLKEIWALQLEWLIHRHFRKSNYLKTKGIKCLSLIFIDRVSNYLGDNPIIKNLFIEKYKAIYPEYNEGAIPTDRYIKDLQGYYFAQNSKGEYSDNEGGLKEQKKIYELILQKKEELLTIGNPVEFVFSHSALGVGWDNPNVFNIATLNTAYSEIRKRQEIGRGLRICVNQQGQRVYDPVQTEDTERINQLTVIPNETYETFVAQYQQEIKDIYGTTSAGAGMFHTHKGEPQNVVNFKRNTNETIDHAFRRFWKTLAKKTDYTVAFDEEKIIAKAIEQISQIEIADYVAEVSNRSIGAITEAGIEDRFEGMETYKLKARFAPIDLIKELSENTCLCSRELLRILENLTNHHQLIKNPPLFIQKAAAIIRNLELDELLRGISYELTGEEFPFNFNDFVKNVTQADYVETPNKGVFDKMLVDSNLESVFAQTADNQHDIVCFIKLPDWYRIKTPIGDYEPDFGLVMKRKSLKTGTENEYYFVVEIKGTNDLNNKKALTESETYKIKCAMKHFQTLGNPDLHRHFHS